MDPNGNGRHGFFNTISLFEADKQTKNVLNPQFFEKTFVNSLIPPKPCYARCSPKEVLNYVAKYVSRETGVEREKNLNLFLESLFNVQFAFFIYRNNADNTFFIRVISGEALKKVIRFKSTKFMQSELNENDSSIADEIFGLKDIHQAILDSCGTPINTIKPMIVKADTGYARFPFLLILLNKYVYLGKHEPFINIAVGKKEPKAIPAPFNEEDDFIYRIIVALLKPIVINSMLRNNIVSRMNILSEFALTVQDRMQTLSSWLEAAVKTARIFLNVERSCIYLSESNDKYLDGVINTQLPLIVNKIAKILNSGFSRGIVRDVFERRRPILLNSPVRNIFYTDRSIENAISNYPIKNTYCSPIMMGDELYGVFEVMNTPDDITIDDKDFAQSIVNICALGFTIAKLPKPEDDDWEYPM